MASQKDKVTLILGCASGMGAATLKMLLADGAKVVGFDNNEENMAAAMQFMNDICTYDPMYITSSFNSGELIISYLMFTKNRLEDIRDSLRI